MWKIKILEGLHQCVTHMISQDHSKLDYKKIAKQILLLIRKDPTISIPTLIEETKKKSYTLTQIPTEKQGWKHRASVWKLGGIIQTVTQLSLTHENNHRFSYATNH